MSDFNQITGRQIAAARTLLGMGQVQLASLAHVSAPTLRRLEAHEFPVGKVTNNVRAIIEALQENGIEFIGRTGVNLKFYQQDLGLFQYQDESAKDSE